MSSELFRHFGMFEYDLDIMNIVKYFQAVLHISIVLQYIIFYHILSFIGGFIYPFFPESTNRIKKVATTLLWDLTLYICKLNNVQFNITGDKVDSESAIVISNHQSLADHIVIAYIAKQAAQEQILIPRINFFSWFAVWRVPTLRTFFNLAKCDENWELDSLLCEKLFKPIFESGVPEWIVLFPEVNIWTQEDSNLVKKQCQKYFLPNLENVLYPRFSGFYNVMSTFDTNPNKFTRLYDITISYTRKIEPFGEVELRDHLPIPITPPSLLEFFTTNSDSGRNLEVNIHVKSKLLSRIPTKRRKIEKWLEKSWMEKDRILALQKLGCVESPAIKNSTTPYIISIE